MKKCNKKKRLKEILPEMYKTFSGREIAKHVGCSLSLVRQTVKEMGLLLGKNRSEKVTKVFKRTKGIRFYYDKRGYRFVKESGKREREEHRLVIEKQIGRRLRTSETVHHIDGDKLNNSLENLHLCENTTHNKLHHDLEKIAYSLIKVGLIKFDKTTEEYRLDEKFIDSINAYTGN